MGDRDREGAARASGSWTRRSACPGLRALDRNFDRLPESLRWLVERIVHDPGAGEVEKPELPPELRDWLRDLFRDDVIAARGAHWPSLRLAATLSPGMRGGSVGRHPSLHLPSNLDACAFQSRPTSWSGSRGSIVEELRRRGHEPIAHGALTDAERTTGPGPARPRRETWPRDAPSRRSSAAGPAPAPRSPPTRSPASGPPCAATPTARRGAEVERRQRPRAQPSWHLGRRARRDPDAWFEAQPSADRQDRANVDHLSEIEA